MINHRLFIHKFCSNSKMLLSSSWQYLLERLWPFSPRANFSSFEYLLFLVSTIFSIHTYLVHKSKNKKQLYYRKDWEVSIMFYYLFWYNKTQSCSFLIQLETTMQGLWKFEQKITCDEKFLKEYWKGFLVLSKFKDVLAGTWKIF